MIDNSWIATDRTPGKSFGSSKIIRTKVILTVIILLMGGALTLILNGTGSNATQYQSEGIVIDLGDYKTVWTDISFSETEDPVELLNKACDENYGTVPVFTGGVLTSITTTDGVVSNDSTHSWGLWYVEKGKYDFVKSDSYSIRASDYTVLSWAYTENDAKPMIAVDATATSIYGYAQPHSLVTLSPVGTEIVGAMQGSSMVVGTDRSSNYPDTIALGKKEKIITEVGTYTDPSYEAIMNASPDLVVCDSSAYAHISMAGMLRASNINAVVIYDGTDLETVLNNIFIVGVAMNYELRAQYVLSELNTALNSIEAATSSQSGMKTMVALSAMASPFIAGTETYINDILYTAKGTNSINDPSWPDSTPRAGWPNITPSMVMSLNPSCIIVLDYGQYSVDDYDLMLSSLSDEWKNTDAFLNGKIYLFTGSLGEMAQRSGPRIAQLTEIMARIITPSAFTDSIVIPHAIGDDYQSYLSFTKDLGFNE